MKLINDTVKVTLYSFLCATSDYFKVFHTEQSSLA